MSLFRMCVGVHRPVGLNEEERIELAVLAERGLLPEFNRDANKQCVLLHPNLVNRKSTLYLVPRVLGQDERRFMEAALEKRPRDARAEEWVAMSPLRKLLVGGPQPVAEVDAFSDADRKMLRGAAKKRSGLSRRSVKRSRPVWINSRSRSALSSNGMSLRSSCVASHQAWFHSAGSLGATGTAMAVGAVVETARAASAARGRQARAMFLARSAMAGRGCACVL